MSYEITRLEDEGNEIFINIEVNDDLGFYNIGRWLTPAQIQSYKTNGNVDAFLPDLLASGRVSWEKALEMAKLNPPEEFNPEEPIPN